MWQAGAPNVDVLAIDNYQTVRYLGGDESHGGVGGLHLPPVYLKEDANESQISVVRVKIYQIKDR